MSKAALIATAEAAAKAEALRWFEGDVKGCAAIARKAATAAVGALWKETDHVAPEGRELACRVAENEAEAHAKTVHRRLGREETCSAFGSFLGSSDEDALLVFGHLKLGARLTPPTLDADKLRLALKALQRYATTESLDMPSATLVVEAKARELLEKETKLSHADILRIRGRARDDFYEGLDREEAAARKAKELAAAAALREETEKLTALRVFEQGCLASLQAARQEEERSFAQRKAEQEAALNAAKEEQEAALKAAKAEHEAALKAAKEEQEAALKAARDEQEAVLKALQIATEEKVAALKAEEVRQLERMKVEVAQLQALIATRSG